MLQHQQVERVQIREQMVQAHQLQLVVEVVEVFILQEVPQVMDFMEETGSNLEVPEQHRLAGIRQEVLVEVHLLIIIQVVILMPVPVEVIAEEARLPEPLHKHMEKPEVLLMEAHPRLIPPVIIMETVRLLFRGQAIICVQVFRENRFQLF